jgi:glyoxylase-like metal-dependent hydrolase (beta-lactamase superfamily II)
MSAVSIPGAPRQPGDGVRLFGFTVGYVHLPVSYFLKGEQGQVKAPVTAYLIDHPEGFVLFDTGLGGRFERPVGAVLDGFIDLEEGDRIDTRLRAIGVEPADIRYIIVSHLHTDHAGGNAYFPNAEVIVQESELDFARVEADGMLYAIDEFDTGQPFRKLHGECDLFGDGTVVIFPTLGHTPGHQSARVRTDGGDIVLTGDCCSYRRTLAEFHLPEQCHNVDDFVATLKKLSAMEKKGARVFPSHDADFWAGVPKGIPIP